MARRSQLERNRIPTAHGHALLPVRRALARSIETRARPSQIALSGHATTPHAAARRWAQASVALPGNQDDRPQQRLAPPNAGASPTGAVVRGRLGARVSAESVVTLGFDVDDDRANQRNPAAEHLGERRQ